MIKAIETRYNGYRFRSRLEARWAVFFDAAKIKYRYEPQGFRSQYEESGVKYLPDFYLPDSRTWVEVKGDKDGLKNKWEDMVELLDFGGVLPDFAESEGTGRGLLLLGDVPNGDKKGIYLHPIIQHHKGLLRNWVTFHGYHRAVEPINGPLAELFNIKTDYNLETDQNAGWEVVTKHIATPFYRPLISSAYTKARQARFEHGECGA